MRIDHYWNENFRICFDKTTLLTTILINAQKIWKKSHGTFVGKFIECILNNLIVPNEVSLKGISIINLYPFRGTFSFYKRRPGVRTEWNVLNGTVYLKWGVGGAGVLRIWCLLWFHGVVARSKVFFNNKLEMEEMKSSAPHYASTQYLNSDCHNAGQFPPSKKTYKTMEDKR